MSTPRHGQAGLSSLWLGCPAKCGAGHKVGVEDALIHPMCCVLSPLVPPSPTSSLRFLVKNDFFFFFF